MFDRIFPRSFDNQFHGHVLALWLFAPIVTMKILISLVHIFLSDGGAHIISTIPLDSFVNGDADTVIALFAHMGVAQLLLGVLCLLVLLKYRSMIPLMYLLMLLDFFAEDWIAAVKPIAMAGVSGASMPAQNLLTMTVFGFVLSLYRSPNTLSPKPSTHSNTLQF